MDNTHNLFAHAYLTSTSYHYSWVGNHWYPPMGEPNLLPQHIRRLFQSENTLWIGDSTSRQDYNTMYQLINGKSVDNIMVFELDNTGVINKQKNESMVYEYHCPARSIPTNETIVFTDLGQVLGTDHNCLSTDTSITDPKDKAAAGPSFSWSKFSLKDQETGKFDLYGNYGCLHEITESVKHHGHILQREYTMFILSAGIWESVRMYDCRKKVRTAGFFLVELLDVLHRMSGPSLFVVWKTHGEVDGQINLDVSQNLTEVARLWFSEKRPKYMDLADFNFVVHKRAFGRDRIVGDLKPHWGLEARLVSIDLVARAVAANQERNARAKSKIP